jgi:flagellar hook-basal body complex protein FliE
MPLPISPISIPAPAESVSRAIPLAGDAKDSGAFRGVFEGAIQTVEQTRNQAAQAVEGFLAGDGQELHSVIMATQRADLAFELGMQVRNKVVAAYQEIMRMQI